MTVKEVFQDLADANYRKIAIEPISFGQRMCAKCGEFLAVEQEIRRCN